ncbi:ELO family [Paraphysoderma sedebokerense]|nr:ELO family [Paraphysoderma sedebokerense]
MLLLTPYLHQVYTTLTSKPITSVRFRSLPFSSFESAYGTAVTYLIVIFFLRVVLGIGSQTTTQTNKANGHVNGNGIGNGKVASNNDLKKGKKGGLGFLQSLFLVHNLILTAWSAILLVLLAENILPIVLNKGFVASICAKSSFTHTLELIYYLNYLTKVYELLDTIFLVVKGKPLEFLHWYHHAATLLLTYEQLIGRTSVSWVPIILNLAVHVIMYWYYALSTLGVRVWWKKYLTTLQITQFVIDLGVIYYAAGRLWLGTYTGPNSTKSTVLNFLDLSTHPFLHSEKWNVSCAGTEKSAAVGVFILTSYLGLFVDFYVRTYLMKGKSSRSGKKKVQ